jgi:hypothetical protein
MRAVSFFAHPRTIVVLSFVSAQWVINVVSSASPALPLLPRFPTYASRRSAANLLTRDEAWRGEAA